MDFHILDRIERLWMVIKTNFISPQIIEWPTKINRKQIEKEKQESINKFRLIDCQKGMQSKSWNKSSEISQTDRDNL